MKLMNKQKYIKSLLFVAMLLLLALSMPFSSMIVRAEGTDTEEEGPDPNFHIYIAFGESNMEGMGKVEEQDLDCDDNYLVMCTSDNYDDNGNKRELGKWYKATPPLANSVGAKLGVVDYFGREMLKEEQYNDPDVRIGIIVVAVRGASIKLFDKEISPAYKSQWLSWFETIVNEYGGNPYQRMIYCAKLAQKDGVIKGIIMHQGESDANDSDWPSEVKDVYDNIVTDLNLDKNTPLLAGEVLRGGSAQGANNNIAKLPQKSTNFHVISSEGLTESLNDGQKIHFTAKEYRDFGKRYAEEMLEVENFKQKQRYNITVSDDGNGTAKSSYSWGVTGKEIYLTATPDEGYKFKEWQVISGGVTIADDKFTVGTEDIEIKAVFEKIPEPTPEPTATPTLEPTPEATPTPTATAEVEATPGTTASPTPAVTPSGRSDDEISPENPVKVEDLQKTILSIKDEKDIKESTFAMLKAKGTSKSKKSIKLTWSKVAGAEKYMIFGDKCGKKNNYKYITTVTGTSYTAKKLKKGTYYKYIVVAVKGDDAIAASKTIHVVTDGGKKGNNTKVKLSKTKLSLATGKSKKIKATLKYKKKVSVHRKVAWESDNASVATVKNGKITAVGKGTCYVYAYAQNGVSAKIKVTVK